MSDLRGIALIGITGKAQQGKSAFADYLDDCMSDGMQLMVGRHGISTTFKETWCRLHGDGLTVHALESLKPEKVKAYDVTHRQVLEMLGDFGRAIDKYFWMDVLGQEIMNEHNILKKWGVGYEAVIIPDVRTDDEATWIRDRGGLIVHVTSSTLPTIDSTHTVQTQPVKDVEGDLFVANDGTLQDLAELASVVALTIHRRYHG